MMLSAWVLISLHITWASGLRRHQSREAPSSNNAMTNQTEDEVKCSKCYCRISIKYSPVLNVISGGPTRRHVSYEICSKCRSEADAARRVLQEQHAAKHAALAKAGAGRHCNLL